MDRLCSLRLESFRKLERGLRVKLGPTSLDVLRWATRRTSLYRLPQRASKDGGGTRIPRRLLYELCVEGNTRMMRCERCGEKFQKAADLYRHQGRRHKLQGLTLTDPAVLRNNKLR